MRPTAAGTGAGPSAGPPVGLTLVRALACIQTATTRARELGFRVAVAVVDEGGHLIACQRMDDALWVTPEIAQAKARAAAAFRTSTLDLEERFTRRLLFAESVAALGSGFVFGKGAVPLREDGRVVGAVGVSGAVPAEHDQQIAEAAAGAPEPVTEHGAGPR